MSTTVTPVATASTSFSSKITFGFKSLGHYASVAFSDLKKATAFAEQKVIPAVRKADEAAEAPTEALASLGVPYTSQALVIERAIDAAAGELLAAVHTVDVAEGQNLVNVQLDAGVVASFKQFIADQKTALAALGYKF